MGWIGFILSGGGSQGWCFYWFSYFVSDETNFQCKGGHRRQESNMKRTKKVLAISGDHSKLERLFRNHDDDDLHQQQLNGEKHPIILILLWKSLWSSKQCSRKGETPTWPKRQNQVSVARNTKDNLSSTLNIVIVVQRLQFNIFH